MTENEKVQATLDINRQNANAKSVLAEIHAKLTLLDDLMPDDTEADAAFAEILVQTAILDGEIDLAWPVVKYESTYPDPEITIMEAQGTQVDIDDGGIPDIEIKPVAPPPAPASIVPPIAPAAATRKKGRPKK